MKISTLTATVITAIGIIFTADTVEAQTPFEIEGPITRIQGQRNLYVMGVHIRVPNGTPISSPSATGLSLKDDLKGDPLPGRPQKGFLKGTAIVIGTIDDVTGVLTADDVFTEPAENVLVGTVSDVTGGVISVNGLPTVALQDVRIPFAGYMNNFGTPAPVELITVGTPVGVEGYYSTSDKALYMFLMEVEGVFDPNVPAVGITRAQGRTDQGKLEVRGGVTGITGPQTLELRDAANPNGPVIDTLTVAEDPAIPGTAEFRFRPEGVVIPEEVLVTNTTTPSTATFPVVIQ
ncbi:MAG: hypothetical protein P1V20_03295 [Verrucomicrobiales bacterium]|nr:hypothetical protein [Verrucomicrobiales bacterium]